MYKNKKVNLKNQKLRSNSSNSISSNDSYDLIQTNTKKKALQKTHNIITFNPPYDSSWFETEINNSKNNSNSKIRIKDYIKTLFNICKIHLDANVKPDSTKAIIVPHAGIRYSGLCSASAYYQLTLRITPIKRIILFCTHHKSSNNIIAPSFTHIKPLLGNIPIKIDNELIETLKPFLEINTFLEIDNSAFDEEHSFFNQLPFIESIISSNSNVLITPFLISNSMILNKQTCDKLHKAMDILKLLLSRKDTVLICTSDFSHINGHFETKIMSNIQQNIRTQDNQILQFIYDNLNGINTRSKKIDDILFIQNAPSCGTMAMYLFAKLLNYHSCEKESSSSSSSSDESTDSSNYSKSIYKIKSKNFSKILYPRITCYYTSQVRDKHIDIFNFYPEQLTSILPIDSNTTESSVSYVGLIFTSQPNIEDKKTTIRKIENLLSQYEKQALLGFVKEYLFFKISMPKYKIASNLINPIHCPSFKFNLGVGITTYYNTEKLRSNVNLIDNNNMSNINVEKTQDEVKKASLLPEPRGYRILCAVPHVEEEFEGGIIKSDDTKRVEEQTTVVL